MTEPPTRRYFRIVRSIAPTAADFMSYEALGAEPPRDSHLRRLWQGVSVYDTEARARARAIKQPSLGAFVAELAVPWGGGLWAERTGHRRGHHTLWGAPDELLACVQRVVPVLE